MTRDAAQWWPAIRQLIAVAMAFALTSALCIGSATHAAHVGTRHDHHHLHARADLAASNLATAEPTAAEMPCHQADPGQPQQQPKDQTPNGHKACLDFVCHCVTATVPPAMHEFARPIDQPAIYTYVTPALHSHPPSGLERPPRTILAA